MNNQDTTTNIMHDQNKWTKHYTFTNNTNTTQSSITIKLISPENIINSSFTPSDWKLTKGISVSSGVYYTTLTWKGTAKPPNTVFDVAWRTSDNTCRTTDFRWGDQQVIHPQELQI